MDYSVDGLVPTTIESPKTLDELSGCLAEATGTKQSVIPWGGGTRMSIGNVPRAYDVALDTTNLINTLEHVPGDMTVVVDAGVRVKQLEYVLAKSGQRLAFEIKRSNDSTIGGAVASNASGRRQSSTGGIRDWVIGMQIVLPDGTVTKSGGRVVKNVQGYELHRLHTGAFGTLGVISQVAFKLQPLPTESQSVLTWFDDLEAASKMGAGLYNSVFTPEATSSVQGSALIPLIELCGEQASADVKSAVLVRVSGGVRSVERQVNEIKGISGTNGSIGFAVLDKAANDSAWKTIESQEVDSTLSVRITARNQTVTELAGRLTSQYSEDEVSAVTDLGFGAATLTCTLKNLERESAVANGIIDAAQKSGCSYTVENCSTDLKKSLDVFSDVGPAIELMRRVKNQYDPTSLLNPGRFVGKI